MMWTALRSFGYWFIERSAFFAGVFIVALTAIFSIKRAGRNAEKVEQQRVALKAMEKRYESENEIRAAYRMGDVPERVRKYYID